MTESPKIPNRREISLFISKIEARELSVRKILRKSFSENSFRKTICFTGPAGVGKSTLIAKLSQIVSANERVAWLACDPSSMVTGGSLLGDRIRLSGSEVSESLFVRSLATRSTQAYSPAIRDIEVYLEPFFDQVWVETAGSGQTQQEVAGISGLSVLILQPETGDEIQWMKSGVRELVDFFVVHKSDLKGSELMMQSLIENGVQRERVLAVSSKAGTGLEHLAKSLQDLQNKMNWKLRLRELHEAHAKELFYEKSFFELNLKFEKTRKERIKNPYL